MSVKLYRSSSKTVKQQLESPNIKILEAFSPEVITFDTKEEFIDYFTENKEIMDAMTTNKLNKAFKINGYTITKLAGVISLKKKHHQTIDESIDSTLDNDIAEIKEKLDQLLQYFTSATHG